MKLYAVGLGPGDEAYMVPQARKVISESEVVVGYTVYMDLVADLLEGKELISTGMMGEVERCEAAIQEALKGKQVCVISSGDAGIYGMAPLLYEAAEQYPELEIEVVPGITAAVSSAAILGSPLSNDFVTISLSDLMTPWEVIEKRLDAVSSADIVTCLYNPQSKKRVDYLKRACEIALRHKSPGTQCGYVRNAFRESDSRSLICTLAELKDTDVDMFTTVIIGNADTRVVNGKLVTARGYEV
ncbi:MAG: precorrin-3B C(17)-methyltransferase [Coriobacteriales bacterium]|jgi:precorrin-3B C17-methyltransferase|nr:precorrin-3B C(17)-methyltransferase [Coriobacteriales bacterium]